MITFANDDASDYGMPVHPVCELFPLLNSTELLRLAEDIQLTEVKRRKVEEQREMRRAENRNKVTQAPAGRRRRRRSQVRYHRHRPTVGLGRRRRRRPDGPRKSRTMPRSPSTSS